jgi:hypothetical protein
MARSVAGLIEAGPIVATILTSGEQLSQGTIDHPE